MGVIYGVEIFYLVASRAREGRLLLLGLLLAVPCSNVKAVE